MITERHTHDEQRVLGVPFRGDVAELCQIAVNRDPALDPDFDPTDPDHTASYYYVHQDSMFNVMGITDATALV